MTYQPYLEAEEESVRRGEAPFKHLKNAASLGLSIAGGSSIINRLLPLLSSHIPESIAKKGIAKISPHLGEFVESATNLGHDFYDVRDFLRAKAAEEMENKEEKKEKKAADQKNIIKQYSPQLDQFLMEEIQKGRPPLEAGALAYMQEGFKKAIKKMTEDHNTPFSSILEATYGSAQQPQQQTPQAGQQQQGQGAQGKAALLQTMQQMTELLRNMRGNG
jgi:hypothetical protein